MELVTITPGKEPGYEMKESLRTFRTNIAFCGTDIRVIMFTSCMPDEGKSTVVSVMIRRYHATLPNGKEILGLSHYLSGQSSASDILYQTSVNGIYMAFAGPSVANPTEMLEKKEFESFIDIGKKYFDYILIDCAPLGAAIDAAVVARVCDGAIMVVEQGGVGARMIVEHKKQLEASGVRILGAVLNKVKMSNTGYYGHYYKKYYGKYYTNEPDKKGKKHKKSR